MCHTPIYVSSYYICVLILLYMCSKPTIYVSSYHYMRPHTTICVLILLDVSSYCYMCPHTAICVLILLYVSSYYYVCPHTTVHVLILQSSLRPSMRKLIRMRKKKRLFSTASILWRCVGLPYYNSLRPHALGLMH